MERNDVFVSYRRTDVKFAKRLCEKLKETNRNIWVDWENLPPGVEGFTDEIQSGIEGADAFVCILSPDYIASEYCLDELRAALALKKRVIPVIWKKFEPIPPPDGIGHINWIYFTPHAGQKNKLEDSFPRLIKALEADYQHSREHTRLLLRAIDWDRNEKNKSYLLKEAEIDKAEQWQVAAIDKNPAPTELHGEYILASRANQRQQQRRFMSVIGILLALSMVAAIFALIQRGVAIDEREYAQTQESIALTQKAIADDQRATAVAAKNDADTQRKNADEQAHNALVSSLGAQSQLIRSRQLGILVAMEAYKASIEGGKEPSPAVQTSLRSTLVGFGGTPTHHTFKTTAQSVFFSPDDRWLVSSSQYGEVQISNIEEDLQTDPILLVKENASNIIISPDSQWLAAIIPSSDIQKIHIWSLDDLQAGSKILSLPDESVSVTTLAFGSDSDQSEQYWLAAGLADGSIYRWDGPDLLNPEPILFYKEEKYDGGVNTLAFSPDGNWMAAGFNTSSSEPPILFLWNLKNSTAEPIPVDLSGEMIARLVFSDSGNWLATVTSGSEQSFLRIWNMGSISTTHDSEPLNVANIYDLAFSPDERWISVVTGGGKQALVWELDKLSEKIELPVYRDYVLAVTFSPDSKWLVTGDWDGQIRLWKTDDLADSESLLTDAKSIVYRGFDVDVRSLRFNSDGSQLAAAGDRLVRIWEYPLSVSDPVKMSVAGWSIIAENILLAANAENQLRVLDLNDTDPRILLEITDPEYLSYDISPDEQYIFVYYTDKQQVWDLNSLTIPLVESEFEDMRDKLFTADGRWLVIFTDDGMNALDLQNPASFFLLADSPAIDFFSPNESQWLIVRTDDAILAWDTADLTTDPIKLSDADNIFWFNILESVIGDETMRWLIVQNSKEAKIWNLQNLSSPPFTVSDEGISLILRDRWLTTNTADGIAHLWNMTRAGDPVAEFTRGFSSPKGNWFYYYTIPEEDGESGTLELLDLSQDTPQPISLGSATDTFYFSPNEEWLVITPESSDQIVLYDLVNGFKKIDTFEYVFHSFSPDDKWLVAKNEEGTFLYDLQNMEFLSYHLPPDASVSFSPDGRWLVWGLPNKGLTLFDLKNLQEIHASYPPLTDFSVDASNPRWLMFKSLENANSFVFVDSNDPKKYYILDGHTDSITGSLFTDDNRYFITYGWDGTALAWDTENLASDPVVFTHNEVVSSAILSGNKKWLVTYTESGNIHLWRWDIEDVRNLACRLVGRNLTEDEWKKYLTGRYQKTCE